MKLLALLRFALRSSAGALLCMGVTVPANGEATRPANLPSDSGKGNLTLPVSFEENRGQFDPDILFLAHGSAGSVGLTASGARVAQRGEESIITLRFKGANPKPRLTGRDKLPGKKNYFQGQDSAGWQTDVPLYGSVRYDRLYPGIDAIFYGTPRQLEFDFIVEPGADPDLIRFALEGANDLAILPDGELRIAHDQSEIVLHAPVIYQDIEGERRPVEGGYHLTSPGCVTFHLGNYDPEEVLVIDPEVGFSTYLGGSAEEGSADDEERIDVDFDGAGNVFVTGETRSTDFPPAGHTKLGSAELGRVTFVTKFSPDGTHLYTTSLAIPTGGRSGGPYEYATIASRLIQPVTPVWSFLHTREKENSAFH